MPSLPEDDIGFEIARDLISASKKGASDLSVSLSAFTPPITASRMTDVAQDLHLRGFVSGYRWATDYKAMNFSVQLGLHELFD